MTYDPNETTVLPHAGSPYPITDEMPAIGGPADRLFLKILAGLLVAALAATAAILIINSQRSDSVSTSNVDATETSTATVADPVAPPTPTELDDEAPGYWQVVGVPDGLNVRSGPGTTSDVVGALIAGDRHIFGTGERSNVNGAEWRQIQLDDGQLGWVSARFLAADTAPDEDAPPPTPVPASGSQTTVCFQDQSNPNRIARLQIVGGTDLTGIVRTITAQSATDRTVVGTLRNGQAEVTLTNTSDNTAQSATWSFTPARVDLSDGSSLAVIDCNAVAGRLP